MTSLKTAAKETINLSDMLFSFILFYFILLILLIYLFIYLFIYFLRLLSGTIMHEFSLL